MIRFQVITSQINCISSLSVPPSVYPKPSDGKFVVRKGSTITLECDGRGNPKPKITWRREVSTRFGCPAQLPQSEPICGQCRHDPLTFNV